MPGRLIIAYLVFALLAICAAAAIGWLVRNSQRRTDERLRARQEEQLRRRQETRLASGKASEAR